MHDWKQNESYIIIDGTPYFVNTAHVASMLTRVHRDDLAELQAKLDAENKAYQNIAQLHDEMEEVLMKDEYKQRLDAVLALIQEKGRHASGKPSCRDNQRLIPAHELYTEALAIARGNDNE